MSSTARSARGDQSARADVKNSSRKESDEEVKASARNGNDSARSARGSARETVRESGRQEIGDMSTRSGISELDTCRSTMSTSRVHAALAALTAEKNALETRLAKIDANLEQERRRNLTKLRAKK